jgi:hypothetical protein
MWNRLDMMEPIAGRPFALFPRLFDVSLLEKRIDLKNVSIPLSHLSIKTTEKHHAPGARVPEQFRLLSVITEILGRGETCIITAYRTVN